jgi:hypothetical protein
MAENQSAHEEHGKGAEEMQTRPPGTENVVAVHPVAPEGIVQAACAGDSLKDDRSEFTRAADRVAERLTSATSFCGRQLLRLTSRAGEAVQDFWSDVQQFRHSKGRHE